MARGPTAYFIFADTVRAAIQAELQASHPDGKTSVATLGKAIGERWQALSDEEKQGFKDQAAERAADAAASAEHADGEADEASTSGPPTSLPPSLVKKIMMVDADVSRISAEGLRAVVAATDGFLGLLAAKALYRAGAEKRKNFKFGDLLGAALKDRRMVEMGLPEVLQQDPMFEEARSVADPKSKAKASRVGVVGDIEDVGTRRLTSFFPGTGVAV